MKKKSQTNLQTARTDVFFAPGAVESSKARRKWGPVMREWLICLAIAVSVGTVSAFLNSIF